MREEEELSEVTLVREDQGGPVGPQDHPHHLQPYHHVGGRRGEKTLPRGRGKGQEMEGEMREGEGLEHQVGEEEGLEQQVGEEGRLEHQVGEEEGLEHQVEEEGRLEHQVGEEEGLEHQVGEEGRLEHQVGEEGGRRKVRGEKGRRCSGKVGCHLQKTEHDISTKNNFAAGPTCGKHHIYHNTFNHTFNHTTTSSI